MARTPLLRQWRELPTVPRGPKLRLATRRMAHEEGAWVRRALAAVDEGREAPLPPSAN